MISYSSWNGVKMHANSYLINDVLKKELGFGGIVVSDYNGVDKIDGKSGFTPEEVEASINAGIDMVMVPFEWQKFIDTLRTLVQDGRVPMSRIDDANRRILTKKFELGLFEHPLTDRRFLNTIGSAQHRDLARQAVRESQVLLKNENHVLPLSKRRQDLRGRQERGRHRQPVAAAGPSAGRAPAARSSPAPPSCRASKAARRRSPTPRTAPGSTGATTSPSPSWGRRRTRKARATVHKGWAWTPRTSPRCRS